jgi:quercetin dioxygenase-like cupin family protein
MFTTALAPVARRRELANSVAFGNAIASFLFTGEDTGGQFAMLDILMHPGAEPPYHVHEHEDETFYILEGTVDVMVDGDIHRLKAGGAIFLPRGIPHTFRVRSETARSLLTVTPSGFEGYFKAIGEPATSELPSKTLTRADYFEKVGRAAARFGVRLTPEQPEF